MGGINFAWLAVWVLSPDWPSRKLQVCVSSRSLGEAAAPGGGECGPCPDFASYTLAFALQLRKITKNLSQGSRKAFGWSERDSFSRLSHRGRLPRLACWPLPPLAFTSGDGVQMDEDDLESFWTGNKTRAKQVYYGLLVRDGGGSDDDDDDEEV